MSKAIKSSKDFVLGRILYHVYGCSHPEGSTGEPSITKHIVMSKPFPYDLCGRDTYFYKYEAHFNDSDGIPKKFESESSLADAGIFDLDSRSQPYNLNRLFSSKEDALEFIEELRSGKFSDWLDSKVDRRPFDQTGFDLFDLFDDYGDIDYGWTGENEGTHS